MQLPDSFITAIKNVFKKDGVKFLAVSHPAASCWAPEVYKFVQLVRCVEEDSSAFQRRDGSFPKELLEKVESFLPELLKIKM